MKLPPWNHRGWWLVWAALVLIALTGYKLTRSYPKISDIPALPQAYPAPLSQLYDEKSQLVRLAGYVGRHQMVVVFFDGNLGADRDPHLQQLRAGFEKFPPQVKLFAISTATPYANRLSIERGRPFPFPLLSDPTLEAHAAWGVVDEATATPIRGTFVVGRTGTVRSTHIEDDMPDVETLLKELQQFP